MSYTDNVAWLDTKQSTEIVEAVFNGLQPRTMSQGQEEGGSEKAMETVAAELTTSTRLKTATVKAAGKATKVMPVGVGDTSK